MDIIIIGVTAGLVAAHNLPMYLIWFSRVATHVYMHLYFKLPQVLHPVKLYAKGTVHAHHLREHMRTRVNDIL